MIIELIVGIVIGWALKQMAWAYIEVPLMCRRLEQKIIIKGKVR